MSSRVSLTVTSIAHGLLMSLLITVLAQRVIFADEPPFKPGTVNEQRVLKETPSGENWLVNGGNYGQTHYSPLHGITQQNVAGLGLAWSLDIDSAMGLAVEPIEVDGTIYISASFDRVFAVDAATGRQRWSFDPHVPLSNHNHSYYARTNKGVAVWNGKVFIGTGDCYLIAIDAADGKQLWRSQVCPDTSVSGINGAPRVGGGRVYMGYGADTGARGSVVAFDPESGKVLWRAWNMPGDPAKGFENKTLEKIAATWQGRQWWQAGGAGVWEPITYDPQTNLVIYGTQGESPDPSRVHVDDRLFSNCIVAVHADTGEVAWYVPTYKFMPESFSLPENFHVLVTDLTLGGKKRHVALTVPRFGGFFVIDARTGELISEKSLAQRPADQMSPPTADGRPRVSTNHNWWPMSFSPRTGLVYVPTYDDLLHRQPGYEVTAVGRLIAWDPVKQTARWSIGHPLAVNGGVLATAGDLVFQGEGTGEFSAYAAQDGRKLWSVKTGSAIQSMPITYTLNHEQYVLLPVGLGSASRLFNANSIMATPETKRGPSRLYAFKVGANTPFPFPKVSVPRVPKPPAQTATAQTIDRGAHLIEPYMCWNCHGGPKFNGSGAWILNGAVPDLRYMPEDVHTQFLGIVMGGSRRQNGMPGFADGQPNPMYPKMPTMTVDEANAIHAYIIDLQWQAYKAEQAGAEPAQH